MVDGPVSDVVSGTSILDADLVFNISASGAGSTVTNCDFFAHRGRDILPPLNSLIEKNRFHSADGWVAILLYFDPKNYCMQGPMPSNVTIRDNDFYGGGTAPLFPGAAICSAVVPRGFGGNTNQAIQNLVIQNNYFENLKAQAMAIYNARNVQISDSNYVYALHGITAGLPSRPTVTVGSSRSVYANDLLIEDTNPETYAGIRILSTTYPGTDGFDSGTLDFLLAPESVDIRDER
jgi:hypothetical protein